MEKIILIILIFAICYFVVFGYEQLQEHLIRKDVKDNYDENLFIFQIVALKKAFNDNEYYYKTGRINFKSYKKNLIKIGRLVDDLEKKHEVYKDVRQYD